MSEEELEPILIWRWPHLVHERQNLAEMHAYCDHISYKTHPRPLTI